MIDLGLDFPQKREMDGKRGTQSGQDRNGHYAKKSSNYHHQQYPQHDHYQDNKKSQLCSFLFTMSGCSQGELCRFKHDDTSRASRGDKERILKTLERMKRTDIDYNALK